MSVASGSAIAASASVATSGPKTAAAAAKMADAEEDVPRGAAYDWQRAISRPWEQLEEDESTGLLKSVHVQELRRRRHRLYEELSSRVVRRGMMRFVVVIVDASAVAGTEMDLKPTRIGFVLNSLAAFIRDFFDQNPLSQMSIVVTLKGRAEALTTLSGTLSNHVQAIGQRSRISTGGSGSLQNALLVALAELQHVPKHGTREVLCLWTSLKTEDPGNIFDTIQDLAGAQIRCSVVGFGAEVHVLRKCCDSTLGRYHVAVDAASFRELLRSFVIPPAETESTLVNRPPCLVEMGFPRRRIEQIPTMCICHMAMASSAGYVCPKCRSKYCDLPIDCLVCGLSLVMSPHLARSYHHLFPVALFEEDASDGVEGKTRRCFSCLLAFDPDRTLRWRCPKCSHVFCGECDLYIHETLHNCPGCESQA